jgi:hypothetical protein
MGLPWSFSYPDGGSILAEGAAEVGQYSGALELSPVRPAIART